MSDSSATLGVIAGSGDLPRQVAEACEKQGRKFFIIALEGAADKDMVSRFPHAHVRLGAAGEVLSHLRANGVEEVVLAGGVKRPSMASLKPDAVGAKLMTRLGMKLFAGDDAILKALVSFFEEEGFRVVGAESIVDDVIAPAGLIAGTQPDARALEDMALGFRVAKALGSLDVGQAVIVENGYVLGVEAAEGTDALIDRCAHLQREQRRAVLVKACKPEQEARADLPCIGPDTIQRLRGAGMRGVAVESGKALLIERAELVRMAEEAGIFVAGVTP